MIFALPFLVVMARICWRLRAADRGIDRVRYCQSQVGTFLVLSRPKASADDLLRKYEVTVDRSSKVLIGWGEAASVPVTAGSHKVEATIQGVDVPVALEEVQCEKESVSLVLIQPASNSTALRKASNVWLSIEQSELPN